MADVLILMPVCFSISMLFSVATFIVYTMTPELRNLRGSIFRSCLAAYICFLFCTTFEISLFIYSYKEALVVQIASILGKTFTIKAHIVVTIILLPAGVIYFGSVYMMWLNLMSFDIWKKFRNFRPSSDGNVDRQREKATFVRYSIIAWGGSVMPTLIFLSGLLLNMNRSFSRITLSLPVLSSSICNLCFYISTAWTIRKLKTETANFTRGENKHHKENKQWFNLYLKMFIIMDGPLIVYIPGLYFQDYTSFKVISVLEGLQGVLIFLILVWKDDVKRSFCKQFFGIIERLRSFFRCDSTIKTKKTERNSNDNCEVSVITTESIM